MKKAPPFKFRLYIAGSGPYSSQATANLHAICAEYLPDRHEIEIVDVLHEHSRALSDGVLMTPMLLRLSPLPLRKIVGTLSQRDTVLQALGLPL